MEIRNNAEALKAFLGVSSGVATQAQQVRNNKNNVAQGAFGGDQATLSQAGTVASQSATQEGFRAERVAAVQQALASGTYRVPSAAVAGKLIDSMLTGGMDSGH